MATQTKPAEQNAPEKSTGKAVADFTTLPNVGLATTPLTDAITQGYPNAKSSAQIAAMTKAKIIDFKANMSYEVAERIGVVNTGTDEDPVYEDRYNMKKVNVYTDIVTGAFEFYNAVMTGNAYNPGAAVTTTAAPTTAAPTTTVP